MGDIRWHKAFTMIELMVVIVIVGILATLSITHLRSAQESALDKEAISNLKLIAAAEKIYRLETGQYVAAGNESEINSVLRLMLPASNATKKWEYWVITPVGNATFNATGRRYGGPNARSYSMNNTDEDPH